MSAYGQIGFTRRDKTPTHWRGDYRLKTKAKQLLSQIIKEREQLFKSFESLPDNISDEAYDKAEQELRGNLDALIDREDAVRRANIA